MRTGAYAGIVCIASCAAYDACMLDVHCSNAKYPYPARVETRTTDALSLIKFTFYCEKELGVR